MCTVLLPLGVNPIAFNKYIYIYLSIYLSMKFLLLFDKFVYFILLPPVVHYQHTTDAYYLLLFHL